MEWLTPLAGLIAAGITVPLLLLLYFLKLKRREELISSTFLWKRAVQDLQVNAPFQRLRRNLLLLLQLLAIAAMLFALARPVLSLSGGPGRRAVILIDRSASMRATDVAADGAASRLDLAKRQAAEIVRSLRGGGALSLWGRSDEAMIIAFDEHAKVLCTFTSDRSRLLRALDEIEPTDAGSCLAEAVTLARAYAHPPDEAAGARTAEQAAVLELFSDGRIRDLDQVVAGPGKLVFHRVGRSADNAAIVAMQARRSYQNPNEASIFASLMNAGDTEAACDVQLSIDGNVHAVRTIRIPPRTAPTAQAPAAPGKASVSFVLNHSGSGVIEVRQLRADSLASDDAAWAVLPEPRRLAVLLVTDGNLPLRAALKACPLAKLDVRTPAEFDAMNPAELSAESRYDVIVLDRHTPLSLARGQYLIFGKPPGGIGVTSPGELKDQVVVDWRAQHSVLEHVNLTDVFAAKSHRLVLPRDALVLSEFSDSPAMALVQRQGSVFLLVAFDVNDTNWPFGPGLVMFCYNAVNFLGLELAKGPESALRVGQPITVQAEPGTGPARVTGPAGLDAELACDPSGTFRFPGTVRAGVYRVAIPGRPAASFAVNLLDDAESDIEPADHIVLTGQEIAAQKGGVVRTNRELWPWLVAAALALVCLEWIVYNAKVKL